MSSDEAESDLERNKTANNEALAVLSLASAIKAAAYFSMRSGVSISCFNSRGMALFKAYLGLKPKTLSPATSPLEFIVTCMRALVGRSPLHQRCLSMTLTR